MNTRILLRIIIFLFFHLVFRDMNAQCAMCKTIVDTGAQNGSTVAAGLNMGILYLLGVPFLSIAIFSYAVWRRWKIKQDAS